MERIRRIETPALPFRREQDEGSGEEVHMRVRCVAWLAVLVFATLSAVAFAQSPCPGIHVNILNIRNSTGTVACALFESPDGFPIEYLHSAPISW